MNGAAPKIEIFAPFGAAFEWMKTVLFRPFDFVKWLTIAFAAFLAGAWGGGFNFSRLGRFSGGDWKYRVDRQGDWPSDWHMPEWAIALIILAVLVAIVLALVFMWIGARGRFIFTDCVVRNRGAIAEPWKEYRREGNSLFFFLLIAGAIVGVLAIVLVLAIVVPLGLFSQRDETAAAALGISIIVLLIGLGAIWLLLVLFFGVITQFMVPVMYRRRCSAREAFTDVTRLIFRNPGPFVLFVLFGMVLAIAVGLVGMLLACLTCCIGALPYISTVLLLPAIVWLTAFKFLFLRQFGDQYDVWAAPLLPQAPALPAEPPPPEAPIPPPGAPA
ncbi:MAG TPA: hypothetical protein VM940_15870 [Chthoniobacterales bacterium]|jgi:hypothetical protein|nr:hypothetical protein [Chthoniobacterales bacterium]